MEEAKTRTIDAKIDSCNQRIVEASRELLREAEEEAEVTAVKRTAGMAKTNKGTTNEVNEESGISRTGATSSQGNSGSQHAR